MYINMTLSSLRNNTNFFEIDDNEIEDILKQLNKNIL